MVSTSFRFGWTRGVETEEPSTLALALLLNLGLVYVALGQGVARHTEDALITVYATFWWPNMRGGVCVYWQR